MAGETIKYKRLPGRMRGIFHGASLWLGDDHLLAVSGWRFTEDYKRYYYRDIQALVVTRERRFVAPLPWVLAVVAAGATYFIAKASSAGWLADGCAELLAVLFLYLAIVSVAQSCRCRIQTAVSREELPSLYRMWSTRKALALIERRIGEAQGMLVEGWTASVPEYSTPSPAAAPDPTPSAGRLEEKAAGPRRRMRVLELALYACLALSGVLLLYGPTGAFWPVLAGQIVLGAGVLVGRHLYGGPRSVSVLAILMMVLAGGVAYSDNILSALRQVQAHPRTPVFTVNSEEMGRTPVLNGIYAGGCITLAAAGALSALLRRKE